MKLSDIKGQDAFKTIGKVVGYLRELFKDEKLQKIVSEKKAGWLLDFFAISLDVKSDTWMKMYLARNPDTKADDVSIGSVIRFFTGFYIGFCVGFVIRFFICFCISFRTGI